MSGLFIATRRVEHDGTRRVLAAGRTKGGSPLLQMRARFGDLEATGTREAAARTRERAEEATGIETVKRAGREASRIRQQQGGAS